MPHYFDEHPERPAGSEPGAAVDPGEVMIDVGDRTLTLATDAGVFSRHRVDPGTEVLLRKAPAPPVRGTILDLGCGYGPIACAMAAQAPGAHVVAIDVNERARHLASSNASANGLANVTVFEPDAVPAQLTFDAIFSNPPVRIGKEAMYALLDRWLRRLAATGKAFLVVQRHLGADSLHKWLQREGFATERLASSKGYRVLEVAGALATEPG